MLDELPEPRKELSPYAPRIISMQIDPEKIRTVIGPGGKTINKIMRTPALRLILMMTVLYILRLRIWTALMRLSMKSSF